MERCAALNLSSEALYNIYRACRLCGLNSGYKMPIIQNAVKINKNDVELATKIKQSVQIEVAFNDHMPPLICESCVNKINNFYEFQNLCKENNRQTRLKLCLPTHTVKVETDREKLQEKLKQVEGIKNKDLSIIEAKTEYIKKKKETVETLKPRGVSNRELSSLKGAIITEDRRVSRAGPKSSKHKIKQVKEEKSRNNTLNRDVKAMNDAVRNAHKLQSTGKEKDVHKPEIPLKRRKVQNNSVSDSLQGEKKNKTLGTNKTFGTNKTLATNKSTHDKRGYPSAKSSVSKSTQCQFCDFVAKNIQGLKSHVKVHTVEEQQTEAHPCPCCEMTFKSAQGLANHMRTHPVTFTSEMLACNACRVWFDTLEQVQKHHTHHNSKKRPYKCRRCSHKYSSYIRYNGHIDNNKCMPWQSVPDPTCTVCTKTFPTENMLQLHKCQGEYGGHCKYCNKLYVIKKNLKQHENICTRRKDPVIDNEVKARLLDMRVRISNCDKLLNKRKCCNISDVPNRYELDKTSIYPYYVQPIKELKYEIEENVEENHHSDYSCSTYNSDSSGTTNKVRSLSSLSIRTLFPEHNVENKQRRRKRKSKSSRIDETREKAATSDSGNYESLDEWLSKKQKDNVDGLFDGLANDDESNDSFSLLNTGECDKRNITADSSPPNLLDNHISSETADEEFENKTTLPFSEVRNTDVDTCSESEFEQNDGLSSTINREKDMCSDRNINNETVKDDRTDNSEVNDPNVSKISLNVSEDFSEITNEISELINGINWDNNDVDSVINGSVSSRLGNSCANSINKVSEDKQCDQGNSDLVGTCNQPSHDEVSHKLIGIDSKNEILNDDVQIKYKNEENDEKCSDIVEYKQKIVETKDSRCQTANDVEKESQIEEEMRTICQTGESDQGNRRQDDRQQHNLIESKLNVTLTHKQENCKRFKNVQKEDELLNNQDLKKIENELNNDLIEPQALDLEKEPKNIKGLENNLSAPKTDSDEEASKNDLGKDSNESGYHSSIDCNNLKCQDSLESRYQTESNTNNEEIEKKLANPVKADNVNKVTKGTEYQKKELALDQVPIAEKNKIAESNLYIKNKNIQDDTQSKKQESSVNDTTVQYDKHAVSCLDKDRHNQSEIDMKINNRSSPESTHHSGGKEIKHAQDSQKTEKANVKLTHPSDKSDNKIDEKSKEEFKTELQNKGNENEINLTNGCNNFDDTADIDDASLMQAIDAQLGECDNDHSKDYSDSNDRGKMALNDLTTNKKEQSTNMELDEISDEEFELDL